MIILIFTAIVAIIAGRAIDYSLFKAKRISTSIKEAKKLTLVTEQIIASRTKAKEYIAFLNSDKMKQAGLIYQAERAPGLTMGLLVYVTDDWYLNPDDWRIDLLYTFYVQWKSSNEGEGWIEIRDYGTGKKIAKCDVWCPEIYQ